MKVCVQCQSAHNEHGSLCYVCDRELVQELITEEEREILQQRKVYLRSLREASIRASQCQDDVEDIGDISKYCPVD